ncbi:DNA topoisomerase III [Salinivibrio sp. ES.052]|uniref:DNA topoisomerase III n=1 Tax=Salinivibrio sp. ES.052 TaxID=1882823 RepID=UPI0009263458|nr:DNA topoisomerase III [Salinivibrio sp. ES.052]SIN77509.1 DNA topoisomerase-3 [Salinivibrio sp. ES.052]
MARLFIAEKPSLGRAIAAGLPKPHKNHKGYIETGQGDVVTWCIGHLLEQVEPEVYDSRYKKWNLADLPIVPERWQLRPRKAASGQLAVVKKLIKQFNQLIHAGDPDREGQLLVDEVIDYANVSATKKSKIKRLLISDLNVSAVKKSLSQMQDNKTYIPLSISALARSRADWLYGMNLSRAYTLLGKQAGYHGVLSVGRVQTPVLGLVVRRDQAIERFVPHPYFQLDALIPYQDTQVRARWQPSEACAKWQDEQGRVLSRPLTENVANRIAGQPATVIEADRQQRKQAAPLPYNLSALQIDASKRFGFSAQKALDVCQQLYERHKLITYPRSDCRYLPKGHFAEASKVLDAIRKGCQVLHQACDSADPKQKGKAWNDAKVGAHHAIIPTAKAAPANLSDDEMKIYQLVARQYLMQFYPPAEYAEGKLVFDIAGGCFIAKGKVLTQAGWRALLPNSKTMESDAAPLPLMNKGEQAQCERGDIKDCMTEPPAAFTESSLLQAMTGIGRYVQDKALKDILRETDGLGTEATRAGIIELLVKRSLLNRQGKTLHATASGKGLIDALPDSATYPDMTADWERQLQDMADQQCAYHPFMHALTERVTGLIETVKIAPPPPSLKDLPAAPARTFKRRRQGTSSSRKRTSKPKREATTRKAAGQ